MATKSITSKVIKGYKVTNSDFTSKHGNMKWEVGKDYKHGGTIGLCDSGFHFCQKAQHCFNYYDFNPENHVFEVEASGDIIHGDDKSVCTEIRLIKEFKWEEVLVIANDGVNNTGHSNSGYRNSGDSNSGDSNSGDSNSGDSNSGDSNSGNRNSGNRNSGDSNSGYRNSGNWNSGNRNSGDSNSGDSNSGYRNSGNWNSGDRNSGDSNSGYRNSGNWNSGDRNSGYWNSGNRNSGDSNSGYRNSGNWNSGDRNSGDSNSGYRNSGAFCTDANPQMMLFNRPCNMTVKEWENHPACQLMYQIDPTLWVQWEAMTEKERSENPKYEASGGYTKAISMKEAWANFWHNLTDENKAHFTHLPNFDGKIFEEITGIKLK